MKIQSGTLGVIVAVCAAILFPMAADAQDFPSKPIRIVVPQNPGGFADATGRQLADHFTRSFGQPAVVENKPGGNSMIGTAFVARSAPDGYTVLIGVPSLSLFNAILKAPEIDAVKDLAPISQLMAVPLMVAVNAAMPVKTLGDFIAYVKKVPGELNYGSGGAALMLNTELLLARAGLKMTRVNYVGEAQAVPALANNDVQLVLSSAQGLLAMVQGGRVKVIATTASKLRSPGMPDVPTAAESGLKGFDVVSWMGLLAPANTPLPVRRKLSAAVAAFGKDPAVAEHFRTAGGIPYTSTPEEFTRFIGDENRIWIDVAKRAGVEKQ